MIFYWMIFVEYEESKVLSCIIEEDKLILEMCMLEIVVKFM